MAMNPHWIPMTYTPRTHRSELADSPSLAPVSLSSDELLVVPPSERSIPDLSISNDALLASLNRASDVHLGTHVARFASTHSQRTFRWFDTRPTWLRAVISLTGGSLMGLGVILGYVSMREENAPELAAEPSADRGVALATSAAPAVTALIAERLVPWLGAAPTATLPSAPNAPAAADGPAAAPAALPVEAPLQVAEAVGDTYEVDDLAPKSKPRKVARRRASKSQAASAELPSWVQQEVKPQGRRAALRERNAAYRERKAARARARKAKAQKTLAQQ
jgi:hypothetical protein